MITLYFITGNKGKFNEFNEKVQYLDISLKQKNLGYPEIQANTLEEVAGFGVNYIKNRFEYPFVIEDAGLFVDSLDGFPGVYSKYVFFTIGCKGILKLLEENTKRAAVFKSVYAYSVPNKKTMFFIGECHGRIAEYEKGKGGFGFDPIFIPDKKSVTFAEMSTKEKNKISHRGRALDKLITFLDSIN